MTRQGFARLYSVRFKSGFDLPFEAPLKHIDVESVLAGILQFISVPMTVDALLPDRDAMALIIAAHTFLR